MSTPAEDALFAALSDVDDLERLSRTGLLLEAIPTEAMRPVVKWAIDSFFESGRRVAPSRELLLANWGQQIEDAGVELLGEDEERDSIESAVEHLRGIHAEAQWQAFVKAAATEMAGAATPSKVQTLTQITSLLFEIANDLQDKTNQIGSDVGFTASYGAYVEREESGKVIDGLTFGWEAIDTHTGGIRDGELAILAAGPKVGKSYALGAVALNEYRAGRRCVLYTLENSVEMTYDRLVCLGAGISAGRYQRGELTEAERESLDRFLKEERDQMDRFLMVVSPTDKARTPEMIVRDAMMRGVDSILVDQLTHVVHPDPGRKARHELFNENVHDFKYLISAGRERKPLLLAHQVNRDGVKAAQKLGYHEMWHLAESAGIERAADWVFSMYQTTTDRIGRQALLQILAARREDIKNWRMVWDVAETGHNYPRCEVNLETIPSE